EKYVSILEVKETPQLKLFAQVPEEKHNKNTGSYYTPQFIARFFTKFLENNFLDIHEKKYKILEPAVGSGIFIRTFLERQIEITKKDPEYNIFQNILAVDKNPTASNAANLSLSLLHLVSYDKFPDFNLNIVNEDALVYFKRKTHENKIDIIISNPPYIKYNILDKETRENLKDFLGDFSYGKSDLYIAFLKIAILSLKKNGIACFVLPNTFLVTESAKNIRKELYNSCTIRCIIDLSDNKQRIFDEAGVYPILLIFQKTRQKSNGIIAKIHDNTGQALYHVLNNELTENDNFSIYEVDQSLFSEDIWYLLPPTELKLKEKLLNNPKIDEYFDLRTGFTSGDISAFILNKRLLPKGEESIFVPYLGDREMSPYLSRTDVEEYFFYPFIGNTKITEKQLQDLFPKTFAHIKKFENKLKNRTEVIKGSIEWWMPNRPRTPKFMLVPKILTPHLVFTPKFNIDREGRYAISRSPFLVAKEEYNDVELLYYFTGILNSAVCFWYLLSHAPKYQHGFAMLEPTYLKNLPIPTPYPKDISKRMLVQKVI
ncbi:MAG: N-6 DNA methylase, partial [Nitrososphaeraceae archaeon]